MMENWLFYTFALPILHIPVWMAAPRAKTYFHLIPNLLFVSFWVALAFQYSEITQFQIPMWLGSLTGYPSALVLKIDGHRLSMAILSSGVAWLIQLYSFGYLKDRERFGFYQFLLSAFTASMVWLFLASNLFSLFIAWELVGICSYLLVQFWFEKERPIQAGLRVLMVNKLGDVFLISALGLLVSFGFGNVVFGEIAFPAGSNLFFESKTGIVLSLFLVISAFVKSAQFPFNIWLKEAMEGPTSVSALLHSATMVTGGVWLLLQCQAIFSQEVMNFLVVSGGVTLLVCNLGAIASLHIKSVLAFSTMAQLGLMVVGVGLGHAQAVEMHLFSHAFFKSALFLLAGILIHQAEARSKHGLEAQFIPDFKGAFSQTWMLKICTIFCLAALAGLPLTSGFISKESLLPEVLHGHPSGLEYFAFGVMQAGILMTSFYAFRLLIILCFSKSGNESASTPFSMVLPVGLLSLGAGFWLFGPNPFSGDGWLLAFWGQTGNSVFSDVAMSLIGLGLAIFSLQKGRSFEIPFFHLKLSPFRNLNLQQSWIYLPWRGLLWSSALTLKLEKRFLDRPIDFGGKAAVVSGHLTSFFDRRVLDGLLHLLIYITHSFGSYFWRQAGGKPQQTVFLVVVLLSVLAYFFF